MQARTARGLGRALLAASLVLLALGACRGGDPPPSPPETADATAVTPAATRAASPPTPPPAPVPAAAAAVPDPPVAIDGATRWREVYETLSAVERSCMRGALGAAELEAALGRPVVDEGETERWEADLYACLDPSVARSVLLASFLAPLLEETGAGPTERQLACAREVLARSDAAAAVAASLPGTDPGPAAAVLGGVAGCFPELLIDSIFEEAGIGAGEPTGAERACLQDWLADLDWRLLLAEETDPEGYGSVLAGLVGCVPGPFVASLLRDEGLEPEAVGEVALTCLGDWLLEHDWAALFAGGAPEPAETFATALARCAPDRPDDHADAPEGATPLAVGVTTGGALELSVDRDLFRFESERGETYEIGAEPGTLDDPWLELLDAGGVILDRNDDSGASLAARIVWEAPDSARYYVRVGGWGSGTYRLTVAASDLADDHPGSVSGATPVRLGIATEGAIERLDDTDLFSFEAVAARLYQVDVALGTLYDSWVELRDPAGSLLAWSDDVGPWFGSRIVWEAPVSGRYYVEVGGWDTGSYTLGVRRNAELEADRAVLLALRDALRGGARLNWSQEVPLAEWEGVLLDGSPARVAGLFLQGRGLSGTIPPELGGLSGLGALNLRQNELRGTIPTELGDLSGLLVLLLMENELSGGVPAALGDLARLEVLDLGSNRLSGEIPAELGDLASLRELSLAGNALSGCVPDRLEETLLLYELGELRFCAEGR